MKTFSALLLALVTVSSAFAANIEGTFQCDDGGKLLVTQQEKIGAYYADLEYADGSSSTLAEFRFPKESLRGTMLRDDVEKNMGYVVMEDQGNRLVLNFKSGKIVTCSK